MEKRAVCSLPQRRLYSARMHFGCNALAFKVTGQRQRMTFGRSGPPLSLQGQAGTYFIKPAA
jgi:hypothetical protein